MSAGFFCAHCGCPRRLISNDIGLLQYPSAAATAVVLLGTVLIVIAILLRFVNIRKEL